MQLLNFFLSALKPSDLAALSESLSEVGLASGQPLWEAGGEVEALYFPSSACISMVTVLSDGKSVETSTIGRESVVALLDALAQQPSRSRVFAQIGGGAMRLPASAFRARLLESPDLLLLTHRHLRAASLQAEQGVACNATHGAEERLARWLLMTQDRVGSASFLLTQDYMAVMAGVQRTTVSTLAHQLKKAGVLHYSRGNITIRDRDALIGRACECYAVVGGQFEALRQEAM